MITILGIILLIIIIALVVTLLIGLQKGKIADGLSAEETKDLINLSRRLKDE